MSSDDNILKFRRPDAQARAEGKTLCKSGFHRWQVVKDRAFDVKRGGLVTLQRCARCGAERTRLS